MQIRNGRVAVKKNEKKARTMGNYFLCSCADSVNLVFFCKGGSERFLDSDFEQNLKYHEIFG